MNRPPNPGLAAKLEAERKLKEGISGHKTGLPKKLLELFEPLPALAKAEPIRKRKPKLGFLGIAQYVSNFAEPGEPEYEPPMPQDCPPSPRLFANPELRAQARVEKESKAEKKLRMSKEKMAKAKTQVEEGLKEWDPAKDPNCTGDPFKTLFVARISYEATEKKLRREFEEYGPIKSIRLVHDKNSGKARGYAFIEYEHKNDMKLAYKMADGKKIETKRVVVDVERGRTVPNWRPRRFGGGKGGEGRATKVSKKRPIAALAALTAAPVALPPPPALDRDREQERERERENDRAREKDRDRERERERVKDLDLSRVPPPGVTPLAKERSRERSPRRDRDKANGTDRSGRDRDRSGRERERERDRSERKREREREPGERDEARSGKRHREDERAGRRRERDVL